MHTLCAHLNTQQAVDKEARPPTTGNACNVPSKSVQRASSFGGARQSGALPVLSGKIRKWAAALGLSYASGAHEKSLLFTLVGEYATWVLHTCVYASMCWKASDELGCLCFTGSVASWAVYCLGRQCKTGTSLRLKASDELGRLGAVSLPITICVHGFVPICFVAND